MRTVSVGKATAPPVRARAWHTLTASEALDALGSSRSGLSTQEAKGRQSQYGPNQLPEAARRPAWLIIVSQLRNPLTAILFVAAIASYLLGQALDAVFILTVVVIDTIIGSTQELRAEGSAASLKKTLQISPTVIRGGTREQVDLTEIVPGDLVHLESGAVVPADLRLTSDHDLKVDESLLTGESVAVTKGSDAVCPEDAPVGDRTNLVFAGTMVTGGRGTGVVCATAHATELGKIAALLSGRGGKVPLLARMEAFSRRIAGVTLLLAAMIGLGQYLRGSGIADVFLLTTALAVSAIPEGLPMAITVALSVASHRMGKRNVIVRHLPAVEALGSCTIIASDKTGTLTANRLTATRAAVPGAPVLSIGGEGLELEGEISGASAAARHQLDTLARHGILTNEATLRIEEGAVLAKGDTVDIAFLVLARKCGLDPDAERRSAAEVAEIPYEPDLGYSANLRRADTKGTLVSVKGAPEVLLPMCAHADRAEVTAHLHALTGAGYRVLAVAGAAAAPGKATLSADDLYDLDFLGLVGLIDPLRSEAPEAVEAALCAGIDVRMITGDHPETALSIARDISASWAPDRVLTGKVLRELKGQERTEAILGAQVFARVEPAQKTLIVSELQDHGHFVAVTGDGVNDAPALKKAHVGVAMGAGGTDVARASADLIITDDNFGSIVAGIEEGRAAYDNIRKIIWLLISTAITAVGIFALALFTGLPIPLTPVQILWLNLVTEGIQDVALAFEGKEEDLMRRSPRHPTEPVFNRQMIEQCLLVGFYTSLLAFGLYYWLHEMAGVPTEEARNVTLLFLVLFNNFHTLNCRSESRSILKVPLSANPFLIWSVVGAQGLHILAMHVPLLSDILEIAPVTFGEWSLALALAATVLVLGEGYKALVVRPRERVQINNRR